MMVFFYTENRFFTDVKTRKSFMIFSDLSYT